MIQSGEVDITINVKSTKALRDHADFVAIPYQRLTLALYQHQPYSSEKIVSGIRGFDYHGERLNMVNLGFKFIDLPNTQSAVQVFVKKRSTHLISYRGPADYYLQQFEQKLTEQIRMTPLLEVDTHYAVGKKSRYSKKIIDALNDYAKRHDLKYFRESASHPQEE